LSYEGVKYQTIFSSNSIPEDPRIDELRKWCKIFNEKQLAPSYPGGTHGNMSFRLEPEKPEIIITAARTSFAEFMSDDSFFTIESVDFKNLTVSASGSANREPSSETLLHFAIYQQRPDVQAILHGHCESITKNAQHLNIPTTKEFVESGNMVIVESVLEILKDHQFIEIKDHGFLSLGSTIEEAGNLAMEMLEKSYEFGA
jgi:L-ribulose-5-phosphate 4-epimerase